MIVINTKTNEAYSNASKAAAAELVGVSTSTIHRWSKLRTKEIYRNWTIYFNEEKLKQKKGYALFTS